MPLDVDSPKIVIAGASSLLGVELREQLEASRFAVVDFRLVDEELAAGTLTEAGEEAAVIQAVDEDSFARARFVFFAGSEDFTRANLDAARRGGGTVIDLSGGTLGATDMRLWHSGAEAQVGTGNVYAVLSAPATAVVSLLDALTTIGLPRIGFIFFRPVSEAGRSGIEELESQTSQLLSFKSPGQAIFGTQVAFSLLNRYGEESREDLSKVRERIRKEVCPFVRKQGVAPTIQVVHAPVFYGYTFAAFAEAESAIKREKLAEVCEKTGFVLWKDEEGPLGNLAVGDAAMHLAPPETDLPPAATWWSWGAVDNIKLPAASAVKLAEKLI